MGGVAELPGWAISVGAVLVSVVIALVGWLLKRAIGDLDKRFSDLALQIGQLQERLESKVTQTGEHAVSLGIVSAQVAALDKRLSRLEGEAGTCVLEGRIKALEVER
jgi:hypothetical protein